MERKRSHRYSRGYWLQSLSTSPGAAQSSGTELCRFQEVLCSCFRDSYFSVPFGGSLCELLTSLRSPAVGMDPCRSLTFKFRITPLPAKYSQGGFYGGCKLWTIREEWLVLWVEQDLSAVLDHKGVTYLMGDLRGQLFTVLLRAGNHSRVLWEAIYRLNFRACTATRGLCKWSLSYISLCPLKLHKTIKNESLLKQMLAFPFRWALKLLYRAFSPGVFLLQKYSFSSGNKGCVYIPDLSCFYRSLGLKPQYQDLNTAGLCLGKELWGNIICN